MQICDITLSIVEVKGSGPHEILSGIIQLCSQQIAPSLCLIFKVTIHWLYSLSGNFLMSCRFRKKIWGTCWKLQAYFITYFLKALWDSHTLGCFCCFLCHSIGSKRGELSRGAQPSLASVGSERFNKTTDSESSYGVQPPTLSVEEANPVFVQQVFDLFKLYLNTQLEEKGKGIEWKNKTARDTVELKSQSR